MSLVTFPSQSAIATIQWTPPASTQENRSPWSGKQRVTKLPFGGYWKARVTLKPIVSEADFLVWRAFLAELEGRANTTRIVAVEAAQNAQAAVKVNGAGQTGLSLITDGWTGSGTALAKGQLITVADQLIPVAAAGTISSGANTISLARRLRASPADNADVEVASPYALMRSTSDELPWLVSPAQIYGLSFEFEEAVE